MYTSRLLHSNLKLLFEMNKVVLTLTLTLTSIIATKFTCLLLGMALS
jgi:hypothetical protein